MIAEPSNRSDEWSWQVVNSDGVIVGLFQTKAKAEAWIAEEKARLCLYKREAA